MVGCTECGKEFTDNRGLTAHNRMKHPYPIPDDPTPTTASPEPAPEPRRNMPTELKPHPRFSQAVPNAYLAGRRVKMLQPRCDKCQDTGLIPEDWWTRCPHFHGEGLYTEISLVPIEEAIATEPDPIDPTIQVVSAVQPAKRMQHISTLRLIQVPLDIRVNSGKAVEMARREGCIEPHELGYQDFCQALDCWNFNPKVGDAIYGLYCSKFHYQLTVADIEGRVLEGLDERRRYQMLNEIAVP